MNDSAITLARQPILGTDGKLFGYELLYRGVHLESTGMGTAQTARVLCEAIGNIGLEHLVGDARVFVNFDQDLLETDFYALLPPGQGVVEILETVEATPRVLETLQHLRHRGIAIAADDFVFQPNALAFLPLVDYVKVDILLAKDQLASYVSRLKGYPVQLLAEKVETHEQVALCRDLGFRLFQGYYFARPESVPSQPISATQIGVVDLISELQKPDYEAIELGKKIGADLVLAHQILKLANSAAFRRRRAINSIADAVILLGQDVIRQWASMLLLTRLADNKPSELLVLALIRGRMCEALGAQRGTTDASQLFTAGVLSVLDALLNRPMNEVVTELALAAPLGEALCGNDTSSLGHALQRAIAYERGDWSFMDSLSAREQSDTLAAYVKAANFANLTVRATLPPS
jgi:EAL and modified HD-GYP domain-containing signal transduction protein